MTERGILIRTPEYLMEKLGLTHEEAVLLIEDDKIIEDGGKTDLEKAEAKKKPAPLVKKKKGGISPEELTELYALILGEYGEGVAFQNKHISHLGETMGLSSRQTPSRLKRLAEEGKLEEVSPSEVSLPGKTSSKAYKIIGG